MFLGRLAFNNLTNADFSFERHVAVKRGVESFDSYELVVVLCKIIGLNKGFSTWNHPSVCLRNA